MYRAERRLGDGIHQIGLRQGLGTDRIGQRGLEAGILEADVHPARQLSGGDRNRERQVVATLWRLGWRRDEELLVPSVRCVAMQLLDAQRLVLTSASDSAIETILHELSDAGVVIARAARKPPSRPASVA